ncbi:MAG TPA: hypothetical protein VHE34_24085 [Puia sp.]|uniref:hypothetical protein n=1 Tax=Puia sp. TaxID=2045100 RepID=UPI002C42C41A|nr:hypothetical protein [Puia sp.]HVU98334.1 hypothetical protein [Puia sp.]
MNLASQNRFYGFVARNFHRLFWPALAGTLCILLFQLKNQAVLRTDTSPMGIVSLETGGFRTDTAIIAAWRIYVPDIPADDFCEVRTLQPTRLEVARSVTYWDFFFIVFYTALFIVVLSTLQAERKSGKAGGSAGFSHLLMGLVALAALCGFAGDWGLLQFIAGSGTAAAANFTRATQLTKMGILLLLTLYIVYVLIFRHYGLQWVSNYLRTKSLQAFRFRLILLGVICFSAPIWLMDQGQDLLVNTNAEDKGVFLFIMVVVIAALLNWWLAKLFFESRYVPPFWPLNEPVFSKPVDPEVYAAVLASEKKVSRYLGICTIVIPAVAILNALAATRLHYWMDIFSPVAWLAGLLVIFFVLVQQNVAEKLFGWTSRRLGRGIARGVAFGLIALAAVILPSFFRLFLIPHNREAPQSLNFLFADLLLIAFAFYLLVSLRDQLFDNKGWLGEKIGRLILPAAGAMALGFILYTIFPFAMQGVVGCYLSLPVLLAGIVFYILVVTLILRAGQMKRINFLLFLLSGWVLIVVNGSNNFHAVHRMPVAAAPAAPKLTEYFKQWVLARQEEIRAAPAGYPVFLVNSYGGGIRAAAWTNFVLSYLDDSLLRRDSLAGLPRRGFEHYVFSLSGASGGTIGSAVQCAYRATHPDSMAAGGSIVNPYANFQEDFERFYRHDFLTPVLASILGRDAWSSAVTDGWTSLNGTLWWDRAAIQEELWARYGRQELGLNLDSEFHAIWDPTRMGRQAYDIPLLFSNTLNVDNGLKGICAPVSLDFADFPEVIQVGDRVRALNANARAGGEPPMSISLITGAFLSARFPYISPSGKMGPAYHFMDGGGKDNSGAGTSAQIFFALSRAMEVELAQGRDSSYVSLLRKLKIYFVSISNSATTTLRVPPPDDRRVVKNRLEPLNPVVGIINSGINGNAMEADSALRSRFAGNPLFASLYGGYFSVWPNTFCINSGTDSAYCPLAPLGWQISRPSLRRLEGNFEGARLAANPEGVFSLLRVPGLR